MAQSDIQHPLFPVKMHANWCAERQFDIADNLRDWLLEPSSLTARLKQHCLSFRVEVLGQQVEACCASEATDDIQVGQEVLVREVLLYCDDKPHVFARSLLPLSSLTGEEKQLATLGNQSLGQVLFNHPQLKRKKIELACFDQASTVGQLTKHLQLPFEQVLWGRRSVFVIEGKPLSVAEIFLPEAAAYQQGVNEL